MFDGLYIKLFHPLPSLARFSIYDGLGWNYTAGLRHWLPQWQLDMDDIEDFKVYKEVSSE